MPDKVNHPGVYVEEVMSGVKTITGVSTGVAAFVGQTQLGPINQPEHISSFAEFKQQFGEVQDLEMGYALQQFFLNGGTEAWVARVAEDTSGPQLLAGIKSLNAVDLFNLLVLPGVSIPTVLLAAVDYCQQRRAFLILDSPAATKTPDQMVQAQANGVFPRTSYAAVYYPWVKIANPLNNGQTRITSPGGAIAGIIARTDMNRGVWKAPAGTDAVLQGVQGFEHELTELENEKLNSLGLNCLRTFPGRGNVVWGARTLDGTDQMSSEWKYIPVRRFALFIEESLYRGTKWVVFEPNGEPLWAQLRLNIGAFMHDLFRQGAFQGTTPKDAYFVKCDLETTTAADLTNGVVNIEVGFAPLKPAEFVFLKITQPAGQSPP